MNLARTNAIHRPWGIEQIEQRLLLTARLFADVEIANIGSNPGALTQLGEQLVFIAQDSEPRNDGAGFQVYSIDETSTEASVLQRFDDRSLSSEFQVAGDLAFFATAGPHGEDQVLWKTDGTASGTEMVKTLANLSQNTARVFATVADQMFYFVPRGSGQGLWRTDGSEPVLVSNAILQFEDPVAVNDTLFFMSVDAAHGEELWKTDGTNEGTQLVKDIHPGDEGSDIGHLTAFGNELLFFADNGTNGRELWISDGTDGGTRQVTELVPGEDGGRPRGLIPAWSVAGNAVAYFSAAGDFGSEIYRTDGTADGTFLLKDINPGVFGSDPFPVAMIGDQLLFNTFVDGRQLWITDGTQEGTNPYERHQQGWGWMSDEVVPLNESTYLAAGDSNGFLATSTADDGRDILAFDDGTPAGPQPILGTEGKYPSRLEGPRNFVQIAGHAFYSANDGINGSELWKTDGTFDGTSMVQNIADPGSFGSDPLYPVAIDRTVYFTARATGIANEFLGREIWRSDGTSAGTTMLKDIAPGPNEQDTVVDPNFTKLGDVVIFLARSDENNYELWRTDGSEEGTVLVRDIWDGAESSFPDLDDREPRFTVFAGEAYFVANDGRGENLWKTDGTSDGTVLVHRVRRDGRPSIQFITAFEDAIYYAADDGVNGRELWKTMGTPGDAQLVTRFTGNAGAEPAYLTVLGERLFFVGKNDSGRFSLWSSDGTLEGTQPIANNALGTPENLTVMNDQLFFTVETSSNHEIWVLDGASQETRFLLRLERRSEPLLLTAVEDRLFFFENIDGQSLQLWSSDGSAVGTVPIEGATWERPFSLRDAWAVGGKLAFEAGTRDELALWLSDGTPERTSPITGLQLFQPFSRLRVADIADDIIFIAADDGIRGNELWSIDWQNPPVPQIAEIAINGAKHDRHRLQSISARFTHDVSASLTFDSLSLVNVVSGAVITVDGSVEWEPEQLTATWFLSDDLGPGKYRLSVDSDVIQNATGEYLDGNHDFVGGDDHSLEFDVYLAGDANLDGAVKFDDFLLFSKNFGKQVERSAEGDFDGDGKVGFADFLLLSKNFGKQQGNLR